jgi:vancomycin aglycone glucosyltransferase
MKIACVVLGTRGDVQPMVALACTLISRGHKAILYAPVENEELARMHSCPFVAFGPEIKKKINEKPGEQTGGVAVKISPAAGKKFTIDQIDRLPEIVGDADLILGVGIVLGVHTAADIMKVPYRLVAFYPVILGTTPDDPLKSRMMFGFGKSVMNMMMKGFINKKRAMYGLAPIRDIWAHWMGERVILACDRELNTASERVAFPFTQTGFMLLPAVGRLPAETEAFLTAGEPPVYIGFGSNPITSAEKYSRMFERVREATGRRFIISKGWAGLDGENSKDILYIDDVPFDLLFPRLAAAVYHGGTGTLAAIARAGIPQAAFPFMGDQFDNRKQIVKLGLGPETCDFKKMTADSMIAAVTSCTGNGVYRQNAAEMAEKLKQADGLKMTVDLIEKEFGTR